MLRLLPQFGPSCCQVLWAQWLFLPVIFASCCLAGLLSLLKLLVYRCRTWEVVTIFMVSSSCRSAAKAISKGGCPAVIKGMETTPTPHKATVIMALVGVGNTQTSISNSPSFLLYITGEWAVHANWLRPFQRPHFPYSLWDWIWIWADIVFLSQFCKLCCWVVDWALTYVSLY